MNRIQGHQKGISNGKRRIEGKKRAQGKLRELERKRWIEMKESKKGDEKAK